MRLFMCMGAILGIVSFGIAQGAVDTVEGKSSKQSVKSSSKGKQGKANANKSKAKKSSTGKSSKANKQGKAKTNKSKAKKSSGSLNTSDTTAPVITLNGVNPQVVSLNAAYFDPGAIVTDDVDAPTTISGSGAINITTVGNYTITYTTRDAAGNAAQVVTRIVSVVAAPIEEQTDMIPVKGGTLPEGSGLVGQTVSDFEIGKYELTWGEWKEVTEWAVNNGYTDLQEVSAEYADNFPVSNVSWYDICKWCNARSEKEGLTPVYQVNGAVYKTGESVPSVNSVANGYRLPLEKEWEWAARGGMSSQGFDYSGSNDLNEVAWYSGNNIPPGTKAVGTKSANELGIHDMSGNVYECCWDLLLGTSKHHPPLRGGSYSWDVKVAYQLTGLMGYRYPHLGFRLARNSRN